MSQLLKIFDDLVTIEIESLPNLTASCCHSILFSTSKTNLMAIYFILFLLSTTRDEGRTIDIQKHVIQSLDVLFPLHNTY